MNPIEGVQIVGIQLDEDAVSITYVRVPEDIRKNGLLWQHHVAIPRDSDYEEEIDAFEEALTALLMDALEDQDSAEPIDLEEDDDDIDEEEDEHE